MPRDSQGQYSLPTGYRAVTGQTIQATQHNPPLEDLAQAMTGSLPRNGSAPMLADIPMGGYRGTGAADGIDPSDFATIAQLRNAVPPGVVLNFAGLNAPSGYLLCYGQEVSRSDYAQLFAVIGTYYGAGDGSTTFNVPDIRGRVVAGKDNMGGTVAGRLTGTHSGFDEALTLGGVGGAESHTLTQAELPVVTPTFTGAALPAHGHPSRWGVNQGDSHSTTGGIGMVASGQTDEPAHTAGLGSNPGQQIGGASAGTPTGTISSFGSGNEHANVQPTMIMSKIIKT